MDAFKDDIKDGLIRILIRIDDIKCKVYNAAPEYLSPEKDEVFIQASIDHPFNEKLDILQKDHLLKINERQSDDEFIVFELQDGGIWFDLPMEDVSDVWVSDFRYEIKNKQARFIQYSIRDLNHTLEWLQNDEESGEIRSLSNYTKKFIPSHVALEDKYSGEDILKCADMIGRAIQKIDLRSRSALIRLNTDEGRLEPLTIEMADRLGYEIITIKENNKADGETGNKRATHSIRLKR